MNRHQLREHLFKLLYLQEFFKGEELEEQVALYFTYEDSFRDDEILALMSRLENVNKHIGEIDAKISSTARGWKLERMSKVDLSILRLGVYELLFDDSIPDKVAINEAVEISKTYGGEDTSSFINGILGELSRSIDE